MKICVAQTRPLKGDIKGNIENHKKLIASAVSHQADLIIFPELSLTGYEPGLGKKRMAQFERLAKFDVSRGAGVKPLQFGGDRHPNAPCCRPTR